MKTTFLSLLSAFCLLAFAPAVLPAETLLNAGFERGLPPNIDTYRLDASIDTSRAHSGRASLRLDKKTKDSHGTFSFNLGRQLDSSSNCEYSLWVYTGPDTQVRLFITAEDDAGERLTVANTTGQIKPGQWNRISGMVYAGDWRKEFRNPRFDVRVYGDCWIDDVTMVSGLPETPSQVWPKLKDALYAAADKRASSLAPGGTLVLDARNAALAPDTARAEATLPETSSTIIPAQGMLVFAIDAGDDLALAGSLQLEPDADLRPGLRVTVLSGDTVIGAPAVKAEPWKTPASSVPPGPAPDIRGERPPVSVPLANWRMTKGRHYIAIAGPHNRPGGSFAQLELRAKERPAAAPLYAFALFADTHIGVGRGFGSSPWQKTRLFSRTAGEMEDAIRQLKRENATFAIIAGDLTANGYRKELQDLADVVKRANFPVYACLGNHDTVHRGSRASIAALIPDLFPSGPQDTDYVFTRPPLRFIVLDGAYWRGKSGPIHGHRPVKTAQNTYRDGMIDWLRETLAKDTVSPTIVISHFQFYRQRGVSDASGYDFGKEPARNKALIALLAAAPNVVAAMSGHHHYNALSTYRGITCLETPSLVAWPNAYRVFRVYPDRMEWEVRQISNRGLIREGIIPEMALLWELSTAEGDLSGSINLSPIPKLISER